MHAQNVWRRNRAIAVSVLLGLLLTACIVDELRIIPIAVTDETNERVTSAVKAHLVDGSTVIFQQGFWVKGGEIVGDGEKYDITLKNRIPIRSITIDEVAAMESYQSEVDEVATTLATGVTTTAGVAAGVMLFKAIFGSCPTTYTLTEDEPLLAAESFSYSVVPRLEARDVDRLGVIDTGSDVVLEVRNEALETHYINQLELLEITHGRDAVAYPDPEGRLLITKDPIAPRSASDSEGRDISGLLLTAEGSAWRATDERLAQLSPDDLEDHIELVFDLPDAQADVALLLRFRNSLLNTVFFYDVMLKGLGFEALDWMGNQTPTLDMLKSALWYQKRMGLKVSVWQKGQYREVAHIRDQGPIAWKEIAIPLDVKGPGIKVRLSFISDNWRMDWARVANMQYADARTIPVSQVLDSERDVVSPLADVDARYVVTRPGDKMQLRFDVGQPRPGREARTYFLAATGYYVEWMRRDWLNSMAQPKAAPTVSDAAVWEALQRWRDKRDSFRHQFESTKIAVR